MTGPDRNGETAVAGRRGRGPRRLRGWGGVGAMAGACAAALTATLLLTGGGGPVTVSPAGPAGQRVARADQASDAECANRSLPPSAGDGPAVDRIKQRGYLIVGVDQNSYKWGYLNPADGRIEGFDIDLVKAISRALVGRDDNIVYRAVPTDQRINAIQHGQVDMVVRTMSITCARMKDVAFSVPYFTAGQQLLVPKDSAITGYDRTLTGKRVCVAKGSTAYDKLKSHPYGVRLTKVENQLDCLVRLQLGQVDAVMTDNALAAGQAAQDPWVHLVGRPITVEPYGVAMNLQDTDLVQRVNEVIKQYEAGGTGSQWTHEYDKWLLAAMNPAGRPGSTLPPPLVTEG